MRMHAPRTGTGAPAGPPSWTGRHLLPAARPWPAGPLGAGLILRASGSSRHLRHGPPQPGHGLDRGRRRLRRADAPRRPAQRVRAGAARRGQRADPLGARPRRRAPARFLTARHAACQRCDAARVPAGRRRRAGARGRPADGARGPRPGADRRRRRRAGRRDDRALAGAALHPRVARAVRARRADEGERDRARAAGPARVRRRGRRGVGPDLVPGDGRRLAAERDRRGRRRRRRRPRRRAAGGDRARRRPARHQQRDGAARRAAGARRRARRRGRVLAARQLRDGADDHAVGAVPGADRPEAADRAPRTTCCPTSPTRSRRSTTAPRWRSTRAGTRSG